MTDPYVFCFSYIKIYFVCVCVFFLVFNYGPLLWMVQLSQGQIATLRGQFTFYHYFPRNLWYSFNEPQKDERLSRSWSHPMVLNMGLLDWESSPQELQHGFVKNMIAQYPVITICSYHVTCKLQSESTHYNYNYWSLQLNG